MSEPTLYRIAAVQNDPKIGEVSRNLDEILARLDESAQRAGLTLLSFPNALTGYGFESKAEARPYAETITGPSIQAVASACQRRNVWSVFGFLESEGEKLYNACVLVGPEGPVATYRKVHLPFLGIDRFADPGDRPFAVHDAGGVKVGMHICYDATFPETGRVLTLLGADLLVLPTNWPTHSESAAEHMIATRALENVVYALAANRVGEERGFRFVGPEFDRRATGQVLAFASPDRAETLYADIDPAQARQKRLIRVPGKHEVDRIADRRPRFYQPLVAPNGKD